MTDSESDLRPVRNLPTEHGLHRSARQGTDATLGFAAQFGLRRTGGGVLAVGDKRLSRSPKLPALSRAAERCRGVALARSTEHGGSVNDDAVEAMGQAGRAAEINSELRPVTIDGEVVTRPASAGTATVHSLLRHLRDEGLTCAPRPIEVVDGAERLGYIHGKSGGDGWYHQHTDSGLASAARLLRTLHDTSQSWEPPGDAIWGAPAVPGADLVYCHGDPGPWNFVWDTQRAVGLLDWDYLHPGPRIDDVAYALLWFVPLRPDALALEWHHFPEVPDRRHRVRVFLDAYGELPRFDLVDAVTQRMQATSDLVHRLAEQGQEPQRTWVAEGVAGQSSAEIAWVRGHCADLI